MVNFFVVVYVLEILCNDIHILSAKTVLNTLEPKKLLDTGGGFYLDEEDLIEEEENEKIIVESPRKYKFEFFAVRFLFFLKLFFLIRTIVFDHKTF